MQELEDSVKKHEERRAAENERVTNEAAAEKAKLGIVYAYINDHDLIADNTINLRKIDHPGVRNIASSLSARGQDPAQEPPRLSVKRTDLDLDIPLNSLPRDRKGPRVMMKLRTGAKVHMLAGNHRRAATEIVIEPWVRYRAVLKSDNANQEHDESIKLYTKMIDAVAIWPFTLYDEGEATFFFLSCELQLNSAITHIDLILKRDEKDPSIILDGKLARYLATNFSDARVVEGEAESLAMKLSDLKQDVRSQHGDLAAFTVTDSDLFKYTKSTVLVDAKGALKTVATHEWIAAFVLRFTLASDMFESMLLSPKWITENLTAVNGRVSEGLSAMN